MRNEYTLEQTNALLKSLRSLPKIQPPPKTFNKAQVVDLLAKEIREVMKKGYTLEQITGNLNDGGLEISISSLKSYLGKSKSTKKSTATTKSESTKLDSAASETISSNLLDNDKVSEDIKLPKGKAIAISTPLNDSSSNLESVVPKSVKSSNIKATVTDVNVETDSINFDDEAEKLKKEKAEAKRLRDERMDKHYNKY